MSELQIKPTVDAMDANFETRKRNTTRIALITGMVMLLITVAVLPEVMRLGPDRIWGPILTTIVAIISFTGAFISARGRPNLTSAIIISTILVLAILVTVLFEQNQGIALSAIIVFVVTTVAFYTLPQRWVGPAVITSIVVGILNILIDFYLPNFGLPNDPRYTNTIGAVVSVVYLVITLRRFNQFALRTKLVISFAVIALVPVVMLGFQSTIISRSNLTEQANTDLLETAGTAAQSLDDALNNELDSIRTEAQITDLADYLTMPSRVRPGSPEESRAYETLLSLQRKNSVFISSYALLDVNGIVLLDTVREDINQDKSDRDYFRNAIATGTPYISPVRISPTTLEPSIYFSAPVRNKIGDLIGVLRARYSAAFLQNVLNESTRSTHQEFAVLVDNETYVRLANTADQNLIFKAYGNLDAAQIQDLQTRARLRQGEAADVLAPEPEVLEGLRNIANQPLFTAPAISFGGENTYAGGALLKNMNWTVLVQRNERSILVPIEEQSRAITLAALFLISLAAAAGYVASLILARPLVELSVVTGDIASGNLNARAMAQTQDEVGELANSFNRMTSQLQDTLGSLERRVAERTADLELARLLSERRAQELQAISDISRLVASEQRFEALLTLVTRLVSERFNFYHVGIFFIDSSKQFAVLQAANSEGGRRMLARGHRLAVGQIGIVGNVAKTGEPRIALDVGADAVYFDNPDLPETRSEMALPLNVRGETIGILDIQSTKPGAFTENDAKTLSILGDQIAIAISNARLFEQNQDALDELQSLYSQYQRQEWKTFVRNRSTIGYAQSIISGKPLEAPVQSDEIQRAVTDGRVVVMNEGDRSWPTLAVPVKLRGQTIGVLNIKAPTRNRRWNEDEINLAQAVSDRLALALENARLLFESQRQTAKEQKIGEVTAKIGASINMRNVLQTAVEELGRALPGSEIVIQFQNQNGSSQGHNRS